MKIDIYPIAQCSQHGIHGRRVDCNTCGRPVTQVPMVKLADHLAALTETEVNVRAEMELKPKRSLWQIITMNIALGKEW